jgi:hypothetical protein
VGNNICGSIKVANINTGEIRKIEFKETEDLKKFQKELEATQNVAFEILERGYKKEQIDLG